MTARKTPAKKAAKKSVVSSDGLLTPPADGVTVRMYRIGHGDCFLLAFPGEKRPVYVLIDCGYKPGSSKMIDAHPSPISPKEVVANIREATGGHIDVVVITHEHQDHVNAITQTNFQDIEIGEAWFAWTEDPDDELANDLRRKYKDKLLGLLAAHQRLAAAGDGRAKRVEQLLEFELGVVRDDSDDEHTPFSMPAAIALLGADASGTSKNKQSMKLVKDRAERGPRFIRPHESALTIPGVEGVRVFALGPPRDEDLLKSLMPEGEEEFHFAGSARTVGEYFGLAARAAGGDGAPARPFAKRYTIEWNQVSRADAADAAFLHYFYDGESIPAPPPPMSTPPRPHRDGEVPSNAPWRRIDADWLGSAEQLALDMNNQTNNSSLVLAFELGENGKVLLFAADAQRGNWVSWAEKTWRVGRTRISAKDLLARTVLYKVGHHGSHNATLNGAADDVHANLAWMAQGDHAREFSAMITAVRAWADTQDGWDHPMKAIKDALLKKAGGRVFQTDTDVLAMKKSDGSPAAAWRDFESRTRGERLYFDYSIRR